MRSPDGRVKWNCPECGRMSWIATRIQRSRYSLIYWSILSAIGVCFFIYLTVGLWPLLIIPVIAMSARYPLLPGPRECRCPECGHTEQGSSRRFPEDSPFAART